jgi:hypothetical protein
MRFVTGSHRRALLTLAESPGGRQEWFLRARGITAQVLRELIEAGLAMIQPEMAAGREVHWVRLTDAGRQALAARR